MNNIIINYWFRVSDRCCIIYCERGIVDRPWPNTVASTLSKLWRVNSFGCQSIVSAATMVATIACRQTNIIGIVVFADGGRYMMRCVQSVSGKRRREGADARVGLGLTTQQSYLSDLRCNPLTPPRWKTSHIIISTVFDFCEFRYGSKVFCGFLCVTELHLPCSH